jgi:ABC-type sugar transport system substrate-binding protein
MDVTTYEFSLSKGPSDFTRALTEAVASKPDALAVSMTYGDDLARPLLQRAKASDIPIAGIASQEAPGGASPADAVIVGANPGGQGYVVGRLMAAEALVDSGGKGPFGIVNDPALLSIQPIFKGMQDQFRQNGAGARVQVVDVSVAKPPEQNVATLTTFLQRNRNIKQVLLVATVLATGAFRPLRGAGLLNGVKLIGSYPTKPTWRRYARAICPRRSASSTTSAIGKPTFWLVSSRSHRPMTARHSAGCVLRGPDVTPADLDPPDFQAVFRRAWGIAQ